VSPARDVPARERPRTQPACELLPWDSEFFGLRIARLSAAALPQALDEALAWCAAQRVDCLYCLVPIEDDAAVRGLEDRGFHLVDVRVVFEASLGTGPSVAELPDPAGVVVRPARPEDVAELGGIARRSHGDTRFHTDPRFPRERSGALYEVWIQKSCRDPDEVVFVAEAEGAAAGYVSCRRNDEAEGQILLLGVHEDHRRRGVGQSLVARTLRWASEQGLTRLVVVTQGKNSRSQRLYQRCGFRTRAFELWYHRWAAPTAEEAPP
jgi:dTDP-4-amino-4,6-dideoxy-D-galactose acyltransferase